ncbi:hypothetical protein [Enterococcus phage vB_EfaS_140]|uniref:Uncharacterized protein n=1 Tax=Enterococcus phage vB_EfaS_140 TaxID=2730536 RepID=A0ACA9ASG2_9CAUD|nr:hypothetical protein [Enterococcus phage vB_EfaS_140]
MEEKIFIVYVKTINGNDNLMPISATSEEEATQKALKSSLVSEVIGVDKNGK